MKKLFFILVLLVFNKPIFSSHDWVSLRKDANTPTPPQYTIIADGEEQTIIKFEIFGFLMSDQKNYNETFQKIDLLSDNIFNETGMPALPYISKIVAIPDQSGCNIEVIESEKYRVFNNINLIPVQNMPYEGDLEEEFVKKGDIYYQNQKFPDIITNIDTPVIFRDFRLARIAVFPIQYNPVSKQLFVTKSITVKITYPKTNVINPKFTLQKPIPPSFARIYRSTICNYEQILKRRYNNLENGREVMLCIVPDNLADTFQYYANWKRQSGIDVVVSKFSTIGATATNPIPIKTHITNAYHNWTFPPTYVLLVGDEGVCPSKTITYDFSWPNEDYFVEIDGNDYIPEMMIGRIPCQTLYSLRTILNKEYLYEKYPYISDTTWFKHAMCCSNNKYSSQIEIKRFTAGVMAADGGYIVDTMMSNVGCTYDLDDIKNAINNGRSILNYRGEGWTTGWTANCYPFNTDDVSTINNGQKFIFITSIGCGVARFHSTVGNCFGEEWIKLGSPTQPRGAIAFIGPVGNTKTTYNNKIDKGIYVGMFRENLETPGEALLRGKLYMYNVYGNCYQVEYHYRVYCILGDPSMRIWKDVPKMVNVSHPASIPLGFSQPKITVKFISNNQPARNAEVIITGSNLFITGITDENGVLNLDIAPGVVENLKITVRGKNIYPYQGNISIIQNAVYVAPAQEPTIIDIDGNINGLMNPNENGNITFTLKNSGTQNATNVFATLTSLDTNKVIVKTITPVSYGNIAINQEITGNPFQFFIKPSATIDSLFALKLSVSSSSHLWDFVFKRPIMGCNIAYKDYYVNDVGASKQNFRMDPGETVKLYLNIKNAGTDIALGVTGILRSNDPYITILDSIGEFNNLEINQIASNVENYFAIKIKDECPENYLVSYMLKIFNNTGYPYEKYIALKIPVSMPVSTDFTGPDAYGYYIYSNNDIHFFQAPVFDWHEISTLGTRIMVPANTSDFTKVVNLPFTFKYYGLDYNQVSISTDGWLAFGSHTQTNSINNQLPFADNIPNMVAPFWDDLYNADSLENGKIYYYNDLANHRFIIEWDSVSHKGYLTPLEEIFQVILYDPLFHPTPTGDGEIVFQYQEVSKVNSNTIGIENFTQDIGLQYVFDNVYDSTASEIITPLALKITTHPPSMLVNIAQKNTISSDAKLFISPNPFNEFTQIKYYLPETSNISLQVLSLDGSIVNYLNRGKQTSGNYIFYWNGKDEYNNRVPSGLYLIQLSTQKENIIKKVALLKP